MFIDLLILNISGIVFAAYSPRYCLLAAYAMPTLCSLATALPSLACRAKKGAAAGHDQTLYGSLTDGAGLPGPAVDLELHGEEAGLPFTIDKVGDGRAAGPNGPAQDAANGFEESIPHLET